MLRNRSSSKQAPPMADHNTSSSFLGSPRLIFNDFLARNHSDTENGMSPNSILENKHLSNLKNPFGYDRKLRKNSLVYSENRHAYEKLDSSSEGIGLAILEEDFSNPSSKMVLFGAKLKVQIPCQTQSPESPSELPKSPADFGTKTRSPQVSCGFGLKRTRNHAHERLSLSEMELSEDYTCVVTHGPNPKTIHIFDNCIVENCCGVVELSELKRENGFSSTHDTSSPPHQSVNFLRFCHTCKDKLQPGKDIFMYRGEKAFCSHECRCQGMISEGEKDSELYY